MRIRVGCSGWSYKGWLGTFYPSGTKPSKYLSLYSRVFDTVEIDSTFYSIPKPETVKTWADSVPEDFVFTAKLPKIITHERRLVGADMQLTYFLESIRNLGDKRGIILIQFPHSFNIEGGFEALKSFLKKLPGDFEFAVEFREQSWFVEQTYDLLREYGITLAWSETPFASVPDKIVTGSIYLRLVGDRNIDESQFGRVLRDKDAEIKSWSERIESFKGKVGNAFIFTNNHFQGFGPATANNFRKALGMEERYWPELMKNDLEKGQKSIFDW